MLLPAASQLLSCPEVGSAAAAAQAPAVVPTAADEDGADTSSAATPSKPPPSSAGTPASAPPSLETADRAAAFRGRALAWFDDCVALPVQVVVALLQLHELRLLWGEQHQAAEGIAVPPAVTAALGPCRDVLVLLLAVMLVARAAAYLLVMLSRGGCRLRRRRQAMAVVHGTHLLFAAAAICCVRTLHLRSASQPAAAAETAAAAAAGPARRHGGRGGPGAALMDRAAVQLAAAAADVDIAHMAVVLPLLLLDPREAALSQWAAMALQLPGSVALQLASALLASVGGDGDGNAGEAGAGRLAVLPAAALFSAGMGLACRSIVRRLAEAAEGDEEGLLVSDGDGDDGASGGSGGGGGGGGARTGAGPGGGGGGSSSATGSSGTISDDESARMPGGRSGSVAASHVGPSRGWGPFRRPRPAGLPAPSGSGAAWHGGPP